MYTGSFEKQFKYYLSIGRNLNSLEKKDFGNRAVISIYDRNLKQVSPDDLIDFIERTNMHPDQNVIKFLISHRKYSFLKSFMVKNNTFQICPYNIIPKGDVGIFFNENDPITAHNSIEHAKNTGILFYSNCVDKHVFIELLHTLDEKIIDLIPNELFVDFNHKWLKNKYKAFWKKMVKIYGVDFINSILKAKVDYGKITGFLVWFARNYDIEYNIKNHNTFLSLKASGCGFDIKEFMDAETENLYDEFCSLGDDIKEFMDARKERLYDEFDDYAYFA